MEPIATIGLDLAKNVFQVHCVDGVGNVVIKRKLRRSEVLKFFTKVPACLVGIEACGTAHYWGRELLKLSHNVKLMPLPMLSRISNAGKRMQLMRRLLRKQ